MYLDVTGQSSKRLLLEQYFNTGGPEDQTEATSKKRKKGQGSQVGSDDGLDMIDSPKFKKSQAISNTLHLQKYKSPHGVFLDSYEKRDHMHNFIQNKKKIPAPNSYLTTVKLGMSKIKDEDLTTDERKVMKKARILAP